VDGPDAARYRGSGSAATTVIFLNDVAACPEDILELVHQRQALAAHMTCSMDWTYVGQDPTFYDVWVARGWNGDSFFDIPPDGNWNSAWNLFWNDPKSLQKYQAHEPFQVCRKRRSASHRQIEFH
jgi:alpha-1,3-mannosyltransferase